MSGGSTLLAAIDLPALVERFEEIGQRAGGLGRPQKEEAIRFQRVVEDGQKLLLQVGVQIDE